MVSVIIVNFNGLKHLRKCLNSVEKVREILEIIVVDNGSTDNSVSFLQSHYPKIKLLRNSQNLGFALANNLGAKLATQSYLLFLNNDTIVPPHLLKVFLKHLKAEKKVAIVQPKIYQMGKSGKLDVVGSFLTSAGFLTHLGFGQKDKGQYNHLKYIFSPKGACLLIKRELFFKLGQFDADYFSYFEETDLAWRVWLSGHKVLFVPEVTIEHVVGATTKKLDFNFIQYHSFKNRLNTLIKNLSLGQLLWRAPLHLVIIILLSLFLILTGKFKRGITIWKAVFWNIFYLPTTLQKRKIVQGKIRKIDDFRLLPLISRKLDLRKNLLDTLWFWKGK